MKHQRAIGITSLLVLAIVMVVLAGFRFLDSQYCSLSVNIDTCNWTGDTEVDVPGVLTKVEWSAETNFYIGNNIDENLRAYVRSTVKKDGVTQTTIWDEETCGFGCDPYPLTASLSGVVEGCGPGINFFDVDVYSTHEVEVVGPSPEVVFYTSDSDTGTCP